MAKRGLIFSNDQTVPLEDSSPSMLWSRFDSGEDILNTFDTNHKLFIHAYYMAAEKNKEMQKCEGKIIKERKKMEETKSVERYDQLVIQRDNLREKYDKAVTLIPYISNTVTPYKCAMYACAKYKIHSDETTDDETKNNQMSELLTYETNYEQRFDPMITALITLKKKRYNIKDILIDAITYACVKGNLNALQELIKKFNRPINGNVLYNLTNDSIYEWISEPTDVDSRKKYRKGYIEMSLLHIACYYNHLDIVKCLEKNGCDLNKLNQIDLPPIYYASGYETASYLLQVAYNYITVTAKNLQKLSVYATTGGDVSIGDMIQWSEVLKKPESITKRERPSDEPDRKKQKTYRQLRF